MCASIFAALFLFLATTAVLGTPMAQFFEKIHEDPVLTYQCFRNTTSFEPPSATDLTILWDGRGLPDKQVACDTAYSQPGVHERTKFVVYAEYVPQNDNALVTGEGLSVELYLLPPYNEKTYYFREVVTPGDKISMKIYDTSSTCENAQVLRERVCPEPCSLKPSRKVVSH